MRIGFTGTQNGMTDVQKDFVLQILKLKDCKEFYHGDCIGSDAEAADIAVDYGVSLFTIYPPINLNKRAWWCNTRKVVHLPVEYIPLNYRDKNIFVRWMLPDEYLERNKRIVDDVEWMIAAPKEHKHTVRSGTWSTIRYAWKTKREITIIPPIERQEEL